jgi:hypothetical protein
MPQLTASAYAEALPQDLYARHPAHFSQLFRSERLDVGVRHRRGHNLFISHCVESRPIGVAPRQGVTRFHVYPRSTATTSQGYREDAPQTA